MIKDETGIEKGSGGYMEALKETPYKHGHTKICPLYTTGSTSWDLHIVPRKKGYFMDGHEEKEFI